MLPSYLHLLLNGSSLTIEESEAAMNLVLESATPCQTAAFFTLLKYRGETSEEVAGMVRAIEKKGSEISFPYPTLDIVGTGGDLAHTVNISTGSAILAAACGIPVAKHGNRSVSSRSGSADVLEAMGIEVEVPADRLDESLREANIAFLFAPFYHQCMKKLGSLRRELAFPTVMNLLGPLLNPVKTEHALIGVAHLSSLELIAKVILQFGHKKRALVFHGSGLDELTPLGPIIAYDIQDGQMKKLEIDPCKLGFNRCSLQELQGGDAQLNASILQEAFAGRASAVADALALNAGAALWIFNKFASLQEGILFAKKVLREGKALQTLEKWKLFSDRLREQ
jgi:anthranilate phosphoribosyltransferase